MQKLKLTVEELKVEGFAANDPTAESEDAVAHYATLICSEKRSCGGICP